MYVTERDKLDSWATDNCCVIWSLRQGTIFIALISTISCFLVGSWFIFATIECWDLDIRNCSLVPEAERKIVDVTTSIDNRFDADIPLCILSLFFSLYFVSSVFIFVAAFLKIPILLQIWTYFTVTLMYFILADLLITLVFTTFLHLFVLVTVFIVSIYFWAVVRSYKNSLKKEKKRIPLPENAIKDFTVDGMDVGAIVVQDESDEDD